MAYAREIHTRETVEKVYRDIRGQSELFDSAEAERLKREGMKAAAEKRQEDLNYARFLAYVLAWTKGPITADNVQQMLLDEDPPIDLGNAAGSIFKERNDGKPVWKRVGFVQSKRTSNHRRWIGVWELRA